MATYYFADNFSPHAHASAIQGNDAYNGLYPTFQGGSNGPKRTPANFNNNLLNAGDNFLLAIGSAWDTSFFMYLESVGSSSLSWDNPITFGTYDPGTGATGAPKIVCTGNGPAILINGYDGSGAPTEGGYIFQGWNIQGPQAANPGYDSSGITIGAPVSHVIIQDCEVAYFKAGINARNTENARSRYVCLRRNTLHHNGLAAIHGSATDFLAEKNIIYENGELHPLTHGVYYGAGEIDNYRTTFRHNRLTNQNIDVAGTSGQSGTFPGCCVGGNFTFRGKLHDTTIEHNIIENTGAKFNISAYGISSFPGYTTLTEYHFNTIIRGNVIVNFKNHIVFSSSPGAIVENNVCVDTAEVGDGTVAFDGISWPVTSFVSPDNTVDTAAIVRNNTIYSITPRTGSRAFVVAGSSENSGGDDVVISNNIIHFGSNTPGSIYAFSLEETYTSYSYITNNLLSGGNGWASAYNSLASFEAHYDALTGTTCTGNIEGDPLFDAVPSLANTWRVQVQSGSPANGAADQDRAQPLAIAGYVRGSPYGIGAYAYARNP